MPHGVEVRIAWGSGVSAAQGEAGSIRLGGQLANGGEVSGPSRCVGQPDCD